MSAVQSLRQTQDEPKGESGTLQRGLAILDVLRKALMPLAARDVAEAVGLNDSTTHRLLQTLRDEGYVCRTPDKRYYAAPSTLMPLSLYHPLNLLRREVVEALRALRDGLGMTSSLIVFIGSERLVLDISAAIDISPYYETHLTAPIHASATGKILLMVLPAARRREMLGEPPYPSFTPRTITAEDALREELDLTAARGFAGNLDENFVGLSAAAAPIVGARGLPVACLTVAGPTRRFDGDGLSDVGAMLREKAQLIGIASPALRSVENMFTHYG